VFLRRRLLALSLLLIACGSPPPGGQSGTELECEPGPKGDAFCQQELGGGYYCSREGICQPSQDQPDAGARDDEKASWLVPGWVRAHHDVSAAGAGLTAGGDVVVAFNKGSKSDTTTIGESDPGAFAITGRFVPALARYDLANGTVLEGGQFARGDESGGTITVHAATVGDDGALYVAGDYAGLAHFHPETDAYQALSAHSHLDPLQGYVTANDPFVARFGSAGAPDWLFSGTVLSPVELSSYCPVVDMAALSGGGVVVAGAGLPGPSAAPGLELGHGTPGSDILDSDTSSYLARLRDDGATEWMVPISGGLSAGRVAVASDGSSYVLLLDSQAGGTLESVTGPVAIQPPAWEHALPPTHTASLAKLDPNGEVMWVRHLLGARSLELVASADGRVFVSGQNTTYQARPDRLSGPFEVRDDAALLASYTLQAASAEQSVLEGFVVSFSADGSFEWFFRGGQELGVAADGDGSLWVLSEKNPAAETLSLADGSEIRLPTIAAQREGETLTLLHKLAPSGARIADYLVGIDLGGTIDVLPDGTLVLMGSPAANDYDAAQDNVIARIGTAAGGTAEIPLQDGFVPREQAVVLTFATSLVD
jgi:hypothetical protein